MHAGIGLFGKDPPLVDCLVYGESLKQARSFFWLRHLRFLLDGVVIFQIGVGFIQGCGGSAELFDR